MMKFRKENSVFIKEVGGDFFILFLLFCEDSVIYLSIRK